MAKLILAWQSETMCAEALDRHGHKAKQYEGRPIRKSHWKKVRDHPITSLAQYQVQDPHNT